MSQEKDNTPEVIEPEELTTPQLMAAVVLGKMGYRYQMAGRNRNGVLRMACQAAGLSPNSYSVIYGWMKNQNFLDEIERNKEWFLHKAMENLQASLMAGKRWATVLALEAGDPERFDPRVRAFAAMKRIQETQTGEEMQVPQPVYQFIEGSTLSDPDSGERPEGWDKYVTKISEATEEDKVRALENGHVNGHTNGTYPDDD